MKTIRLLSITLLTLVANAAQAHAEPLTLTFAHAAQTAHRVLDGPAMRWLAPLAEKQGIVILSNVPPVVELVQKHLALTRHVYYNLLHVMSVKSWAKLTPMQQTIVREESNRQTRRGGGQCAA